MKELIKNTALLTVTCLVASGLLAAVFDATVPIIEENRIKREREALLALAPDAADFEKIEMDGAEAWIGRSESGVEICRIIKSSERGYSSKIKMLIAVGPDGKCKAVTVLEQNETPGLGTNITDEKFLSQFRGKTIKEIGLTKDGGEIDAITGATISSAAAVKTVRKGMEIPPQPTFEKGGR